MEITNSRHVVIDNAYPAIALEIDGKSTVIPYEQKLIEYDLIFIGSQFELIKTLPADPQNGRPNPQQVRGFTDDPNILAIYRAFKLSVDNGSFRPVRVI